MWFSEDDYGGWSRLNIKFGLNNLNLCDGGALPPSRKAADNTISDLVETCRSEGAIISSPPTKAIPFTELVKELETLGIMSPSAERASPQQKQPDTDPELAGSLKKLFQDGVCSYKLVCKIKFLITGCKLSCPNC